MQDNGKSKTVLCIEMLQELNTGRKYKVDELAEKLETNPRNIIAYKQELEDCGYEINHKVGRDGGYYLDKTKLIPTLKLTAEEKRSLQIAGDYLRARADFLDRNLYERALAKIFSSTSMETLKEETFVIPGVTLAMSNEELRRRYTTIENCIARQVKLSIDFLSSDNVVRTRVIHPYKLFMNNNAWFVIGFCELCNDVRYFKLNRIEKFMQIEKKFRKSLLYNERDYFDERGFKKGVDWNSNTIGTEGNANAGGNTNTDADTNAGKNWIHIKLEFTGRPAMYVKEYIYGQNQIVTPIDQNTTILECDMQYKYNTIKFVLGFGTDCKVLEPQWLKDEVKEIAKEMWEN